MSKQELLGAKLLGVLGALQRLGAASYPPTLARLVELTDEPLDAVTRALGSKAVKPKVTLSRGLSAAKAAPEDTVVALDDGFQQRFDRAFDELDRASGGFNYVTLRALRSALADVPRAAFEAGLAALRRSRLYTLDPAYGKLSKADREAAITEAGNLLFYVARRRY